MFLDECERAARITEPRAKGIVASVRCDDLGSALLQFARFRRGTTESRSWAPAYSRPRDLNVVRSAASLAPVVAIVCCALRRQEFRFGDAVEAVQGDLLDVDVLADHVGGDAGVTQSQCQRIR